MKNIIIALIALTFTANAADVVVVSATIVTVDGVNAGKPADTIRNRPELDAAIQRALEKRDAEQAAAFAALQKRLDEVIAAHAALLSKLQAATKPQELEAVRVEATKPEREKKRAALAAELAAKQKEFDALK